MAQLRRPAVITDAAVSQHEQLRSRQRRYLTMMGIRMACLIVGAVLATRQVPLLWLWLSVCAVGMVLLPWLAVLVANDRPAKREHRWLVHRRSGPATRDLPRTRPARAVEDGR